MMHDGQHSSETCLKSASEVLSTYLSASKDDWGSWRLGPVGDSHSLGRRLWEAQKGNTSVPHYRWHHTSWPQGQHAHDHLSKLQANGCAAASTLPLTSSMTTQTCFTHSMIEWVVPAMVMARSVEFGSMSPATCTWAPVDCKNIQIRKTTQGASWKCEICTIILDVCSHTSRMSLILQPPLPMREPHWLAGTTIRRVTGGLLVAVLFVIELLMS